MKTRLIVEYITKWAEPDEYGECNPDNNEYGEKEYRDTFTGEQKAKRFYQREEGKSWAHLYRQQYDPDYIVDPPYRWGEWVTIEAYEGDHWEIQG